MKPRSTAFELAWIDELEGQPVRTAARLTCLVDGRPVWPVPDLADHDLVIHVDELLTHLTDFWPDLLLRQTYPLGLSVDRPSRLGPAFELRWGSLPSAQVEDERSHLDAFEEAHDLSRAFSGMYDLPQLWLFRQGPDFLIEGADGLAVIPVPAAVGALAALGDRVAARLSETKSKRWSRLVSAWRSRDTADPVLLLARATGNSREVSSSLLREGLLSAPSSVSDVADDRDELRVAARLAGSLSKAQVEQVIRTARSIPLTSKAPLERFTSSLLERGDPDGDGEKPYEEGVRLARAVRSQVGLGLQDRADPFAVLEKLGVQVRVERGLPAALEAIAIWGERHGPAVVINADARRLEGVPEVDVRESGAARVTASHELCHLVRDRRLTLAAVDVLHAHRLPLAVEQRARAFAAEFLLPGDVAFAVWGESGGIATEKGVHSTVAELVARFGVTLHVAAWKLEHGSYGREPAIPDLLDELFPERRTFTRS